MDGGSGTQITYHAKLSGILVGFLLPLCNSAVGSRTVKCIIGPDHSLETASNSMACLRVEINLITLISLSGLHVLI